jgi:outer membrane receptor protein involved in Fe transport
LGEQAVKPFLLAVSTGFVVAISTASVAFGQATSSTAGEPVIEEIRVTGSRIVRKDYSSSSPVVTISVAELEEFGAVTVEQTLNTMPQFTEGANAGTLSIGGGVGATLNMRALGSTRNLVLMDQRRLPVVNQFGVVDTNIVPIGILRGVEVLTGGASSVYGSEAISGVVNFQSIDYFEGLNLNAEYGDAFDGGADVSNLSLIWGTETESGRGRAVMGLGYTDRGALRGEDREFFSFAIPSSFIGQGAFRSGGNAPDQAAVTALFQSYGVAGTPGTDRLAFNDDGTLFTQFGGALNYKGPDGEDTLFSVVNGNEVRQPVGRQGTALKSLERYSAYAKTEYDITDSVQVYGQLLYADSSTSGSASLNLTFVGPTALVPVTNPFIPADLAVLLATRLNPTAPFILEQRFMGLGERTHNENLDTTQFTVGLKGDLGLSDWTFDVYGVRDVTESVEIIDDLALGSRLNQLLQAADGGASLCDGGYNPFGLANATSMSAECQAFLAPDDVSSLNIRRDLFEATATGTLFSMGAGDVQGSIGASYRKDSVDYLPSVSIVTNDALGLGQSNPSSGQTKTTEIGAEILAPLFTDKLNLTAGFRVSDQDVSGNGNSWNVGLEWSPTDSIFARSSFQQAIRAPNIGELFSASLGNEVTVGDPATNPNAGDPCDIRTASRMGPNGAAVEAICIAQGIPAGIIDTFQHTTTALPASTGGNVNLEPEVADTITLGVVWQPQLSSQDLSVTIDYWSIAIDDVIKTIDGVSVLQRCFNPAFNPTFDPNNAFCQLVTRESATGTVTEISTTFLNLASLETSGVDVQVSHAVDIGSGSLQSNLAIGWLNNYEEQSLPGEPFLDFAGTIGGPANRSVDNDVHPEWKVSFTPTYAFGDATVSLRWRYLSSMSDRQTVLNPSSTLPGVPAVNYFDLFGTYAFTDSILVRVGVTNITDEEPPEVAGQIGQTRIGTYDVIGPSFTVGLQASF